MCKICNILIQRVLFLMMVLPPARHVHAVFSTQYFGVFLAERCCSSSITRHVTFPRPTSSDSHAVGDQTTSVLQDIHRHDAAGRTLKIHMARVYSAGRGQKRESVQISAEGKSLFWRASELLCFAGKQELLPLLLPHLLASFGEIAFTRNAFFPRGKSWQRSRRTCS